MSGWKAYLVVLLSAAILGFALTVLTIPRGLMHVAANRIGAGGPNIMTYNALKTPENREVIRPAPDLLYNSCVIDLSDGPVEVSIPPIPASYWSLSIFDRNTDVAFVRNNLDTGGEPLSVVVAAYDQKVDGATSTVVRIPHGLTVATLRILMDEPETLSAVDEVRRDARCSVL